MRYMILTAMLCVTGCATISPEQKAYLDPVTCKRRGPVQYWGALSPEERETYLKCEDRAYDRGSR